MKKIILSLAGLICSAAFTMAQTNCITAGNLPTSDLYGFEFKFLGTPADNCYSGPTDNSIWDCFSSPGFTHSMSGNYPVLTADGTQGSPGLVSIRIPVGNCGSAQSPSYPFDCSASPKIQMTVTSSVNIPEFGALLAVDNSGFTAVDGTGFLMASLTAGVQQTISGISPSVNWAGTAEPMSKVIGMSFFMRDGSGNPIAASITISSIKIGDAVTTTGTLAAVNNSLISVYPNPAKDQITIDLSSLNAANALVKITNSNGALVYQETASNSTQIINTSSFNKGIYMVQVSSDNNVSNKKVVIE